MQIYNGYLWGDYTATKVFSREEHQIYVRNQSKMSLGDREVRMNPRNRWFWREGMS